jgi:hypothetical protein
MPDMVKLPVYFILGGGGGSGFEKYTDEPII